jgi:hypothetical protein
MMRQAPVFSGADRVRFSTEAMKEGKAAFHFVAEGSDGEKLKTSAEAVNTQAAAAAKSIEDEVARMAWEEAGLMPVAELMRSIQASAEGGKGTVTGEAGAGLSRMFMTGAGVMSEEVVRRAEAVPATQR